MNSHQNSDDIQQGPRKVYKDSLYEILWGLG